MKVERVLSNIPEEINLVNSSEIFPVCHTYDDENQIENNSKKDG